MPNWTPNWADVEFDHAVAAHAAQTCLTAATRIDAGVAAETPARAEALTRWEGLSATRFTDVMDDAARRLDTTADDLRALALAIDDAADDATEEQARREADRTRWQEQVRAENRRDAQRAADRRDAQRAANRHPVPGPS